MLETFTGMTLKSVNGLIGASLISMVSASAELIFGMDTPRSWGTFSFSVGGGGIFLESLLKHVLIGSGPFWSCSLWSAFHSGLRHVCLLTSKRTSASLFRDPPKTEM